MKVTITQEDCDRALAEYSEEANNGCSNVCQSCLIYQAAKRMGIDVWFVGASQIQFPESTGREAFELGAAEREITKAMCSDWPSFVGTEIELPDL